MKFEEALAEMRKNRNKPYHLPEWRDGKTIHMNDHGLIIMVIDNDNGCASRGVNSSEMSQYNWRPYVEEIELTSDYEFQWGEHNLFIVYDDEEYYVDSTQNLRVMNATYFPESRRNKLESTVQKLNNGKARLI
jgi:hypothetical protein